MPAWGIATLFRIGIISYVEHRGNKIIEISLYVYGWTWVNTLIMCPHTVKPSLSGTNVSCLFFAFCLDLSQRLRLSGRIVSSPHAAVPEDAWCHLVYLIITLPALLHNAALSLHRHLKCLAGLFSEAIMKLCAKTPQTVPPLFSLQPCVPEPWKIPPLLLSRRENKQGHHLAVCLLHSLSQIVLQVTESNTATQVQYFRKEICGINIIHDVFVIILPLFLLFRFSESLNCRFTHYLNNSKNKKYVCNINHYSCTISIRKLIQIWIVFTSVHL